MHVQREVLVCEHTNKVAWVEYSTHHIQLIVNQLRKQSERIHQQKPRSVRKVDYQPNLREGDQVESTVLRCIHSRHNRHKRECEVDGA